AICPYLPYIWQILPSDLYHLAYIWQVNLRKSQFGGIFWVIFPTKSAIYKRDSGAAREEVAVIAETIAIFRDSFSYNRNYRDFE
ncbi:hypothetical protein, partial [Bifidobacterium pseudocatenulatum]|uniref:hypothetical protein n=1 Tax=Bifidobacterium pseudocatenulatum TaxID=28026 RepID=UPI00321C08D2